MPVDSSRFTIREYRPGDEETILQMFARSFHAPRTPAHWRWKFQQNPWGRERISLAFEEERLVGHYAGYPVPFALDRERLEGQQIGDTMTDPSVRHIGRGPTGVLGRTALHFYQTFCEGRVAFNFGFNVANIQKFSLRFLRSDRVEPVGYRVRDLREHPFPPLGRAERWARGVRFELVREAGAEWDELFARLLPHYRFLVRRDAQWVRWRYLQAPDPPYHLVALRKWGRLVGWMVFRMREERLTIGDLLLDPAHAEIFALALRHLAPLFPAARVEAWCPPRPPWLDQVYRDVGFLDAPEPQDLSLMCVPFGRPAIVGVMRENLYYTMGDGDLF